MYAGPAGRERHQRGIYYQPHHPYTKGLLESIPRSSAAPAGSADHRPAAEHARLPAGLRLPPPLRLRAWTAA